MEWFAKLKDLVKRLTEEYGMMAVVLYVSITVAFTVILFVAAQFGFGESTGNAGVVGKLFIAYVAARALFPLRVGVFVVLLPVVAAVKNRLRPPSEES